MALLGESMRQTSGFSGCIVFCSFRWFCVSAHPVFAQQTTGDIAGTVTDSTGAVLPNVTVTASTPAPTLPVRLSPTIPVLSAFPRFAIGTLQSHRLGGRFQVRSADRRSASPAPSMQSSFKLTIGQRTETVEVEGSAPLVELSPNNNNYVDAEKIANVPLERTRFQFAAGHHARACSALPAADFWPVSINGSRTTSNNYFIDGLYNNDRYYGDSAINQTGILGIPAVTFPPDAIEELSVQETPSSEFGVKGGAPILISMKSGTNTWHGGGTWVNHSGIRRRGQLLCQPQHRQLRVARRMQADSDPQQSVSRQHWRADRQGQGFLFPVLRRPALQIDRDRQPGCAQHRRCSRAPKPISRPTA